MRILVDHDEVLCQFNRRCVDLYNDETGSSIELSDIKSFNLTDSFGIPREEGDVLLAKYMRRSDFYEHVIPVKGAIDGMGRLVDDGHDVFIATTIAKSAPGLYAQKFAWIKKHMPWFDMNNLIGVHAKWMLDGDVLFDDALHNLEAFVSKRTRPRYAIAMDRPWNSAWNGLRVSSWESFVERIAMFSHLHLDR